MQRHPITPQGREPRGIGILQPTRNIQPGDKVLIYDATVSQNVWIIVNETLIGNGRTRLRSGNMDFYFDDSLVIAHQKGGRKR